MKDAIVSMSKLSKSFANDNALKDISISFYPGEICCVLGENGAGKSTLGKIISGVISRDSGSLSIKGKEITRMEPFEAIAMGVCIVPQEKLLFDHLTIAQNLFLNNECKYRHFDIINEAQTNDMAKDVLRLLDLRLDEKKAVRVLNLAECKQVELAKAFYTEPDVMILDEPTAPLEALEIERLFEVMRKARDRGACIIYITHSLEEVYSVADRVIVLSNGVVVSDKSYDDIESTDSLVREMAGENYLNRYPKTHAKLGNALLEAHHISNEAATVQDVSFNLRSGEVLGLAGLRGAGKSSVARMLFGLERISAGSIRMDEKTTSIREPREAIHHGVAYTGENTLGDIFPHLSLIDNLMIMSYNKFAKNGLLQIENMRVYAREAMHYFRIKSQDPEDRIGKLSMGNIQKAIICRWALVNSKVYLLDDPTKHLDIPSKVEIYNLINRITLSGAGVILISSDISELVGMCDRILVMSGGKIVKELFSGSCTTADILSYSLGNDKD